MPLEFYAVKSNPLLEYKKILFSYMGWLQHGSDCITIKSCQMANLVFEDNIDSDHIMKVISV